jgi:hypothetical protein
MHAFPVLQLKASPMTCWREPSLEDILADPITQAVIEADGVDANELDAMLRHVAHKRRSALRSVGATA